RPGTTRPMARGAAASLDRRRVVWPLPLALARLRRAQRAARRADGSEPARRAPGVHIHARDGVLLPGRAADPARSVEGMAHSDRLARRRRIPLPRPPPPAPHLSPPPPSRHAPL